MSDLAAENTVTEAPTSPSDRGDLFEAAFTQLVKQSPSQTFVTPGLTTDKFGPYTPDSIPYYIYKRMRRDPGIKFGLVLLKSIISGLDRYRLIGGDPDTRGFVKEVLWSKLPELLKKVLNALDFGFSAIELVFDGDLPSVTYTTEEDGQTKRKTKNNCVCIRRFVDLDPERVDPLIELASGKFAGIEYDRDVLTVKTKSGDLIANIESAPQEPVRLLPSKVLYSVFDGEFGNLRGNSILDPAYTHWWNVNVGHLFWGRWMERIAAGVYVGKAPAKTISDREGNKQFPIKVMTALLSALRSAGVVTIPYSPDNQTKENQWGVELLESKHSGETFQKYLDYHQNLKLRGILFPEKILGSLISESSSQNFAAHESFMDLYFQWVSWIVDTVVLCPINEQIIKPLTAYNFNLANHPAPALAVTPLDKDKQRLYMDLLKAAMRDPSKVSGKSQQLNGGHIDMRELMKIVGLPLRPVEDVPSVPIGLPLGGGANGNRSNPDSVRNTVATTPDADKSGPRDPVGRRE